MTKNTKTQEEKRAAKTAAQRARREAAKGKSPAVAAAKPAKKSPSQEIIEVSKRMAAKKEKPAKPSPFAHDPRLPAVGSTLKVESKGKTHEIKVLGDGLSFGGKSYRSLTAIAKEVTGSPSINGFLWAGLVKRDAKPRAPKAAKPAKAEKPAASKKAPAAASAAVDGIDLSTAEGQRRAFAASGITKTHPTVEDAMARDNAEAGITKVSASRARTAPKTCRKPRAK